MRVEIKLLREGSKLPKRGTPQSGALDVFAPESGEIEGKSKKLIGLGIAHQIVDETGDFSGNLQHPLFTLQAFLIPRSGLAVNKGIRIFFGPCLVDNDYRGEIKVYVENTTDHKFTWLRGDRLCQIAYLPMFNGEVAEVKELGETQRGDGGFGSTGK